MPPNAPGSTAIFTPAPEGGFTCLFAERPEVFSEGETLAAARANLSDALALVRAYHGETPPPTATVTSRDEAPRHQRHERAERLRAELLAWAKSAGVST